MALLKESGSWLENVDITHLVLASGKLLLQKIFLLVLIPILSFNANNKKRFSLLASKHFSHETVLLLGLVLIPLKVKKL